MEEEGRATQSKVGVAAGTSTSTMTCLLGSPKAATSPALCIPEGSEHGDCSLLICIPRRRPPLRHTQRETCPEKRRATRRFVVKVTSEPCHTLTRKVVVLFVLAFLWCCGQNWDLVFFLFFSACVSRKAYVVTHMCRFQLCC